MMSKASCGDKTMSDVKGIVVKNKQHSKSAKKTTATCRVVDLVVEDISQKSQTGGDCDTGMLTLFQNQKELLPAGIEGYATLQERGSDTNLLSSLKPTK